MPPLVDGAGQSVLQIVCTLGGWEDEEAYNAAHCLLEIDDGQSLQCDKTAASTQEATHAWNLGEEGQMPYTTRRV